MNSFELYDVLKAQWPHLKLITEVSLGNLKMVDNEYCLVDVDVVKECRKGWLDKLFQKPVEPHRNDCDNEAMRCMQRVRDNGTGQGEKAIGYVTGRFQNVSELSHGCNVCVTKNGIMLYDDRLEQAWKPLTTDKVWFLWI